MAYEATSSFASGLPLQRVCQVLSISSNNLAGTLNYHQTDITMRIASLAYHVRALCLALFMRFSDTSIPHKTPDPSYARFDSTVCKCDNTSACFLIYACLFLKYVPRASVSMS